MQWPMMIVVSPSFAPALTKKISNPIPSTMSGIVIGIIVAEFVTAQRGLGYLMMFAEGNLDAPVPEPMTKEMAVLSGSFTRMAERIQLLMIDAHQQAQVVEQQWAELKLSTAKEDFLVLVSHELRTPLTSIIGFNKLNRRRLNRHLAPILEGAPHKARVAFQQTLDDMEIMDHSANRENHPT